MRSRTKDREAECVHEHQQVQDSNQEITDNVESANDHAGEGEGIAIPLGFIFSDIFSCHEAADERDNPADERAHEPAYDAGDQRNDRHGMGLTR